MNEPAFPAHHHNLSEDGSEQVGEHTWRCPGMTLRDYFAAKAMQAIARCSQDDDSGFLIWNAEAAKTAYEMADAMLAERAKQK